MHKIYNSVCISRIDTELLLIPCLLAYFEYVAAISRPKTKNNCTLTCQPKKFGIISDIGFI